MFISSGAKPSSGPVATQRRQRHMNNDTRLSSSPPFSSLGCDQLDGDFASRAPSTPVTINGHPHNGTRDGYVGDSSNENTPRVDYFDTFTAETLNYAIMNGIPRPGQCEGQSGGAGAALSSSTSTKFGDRQLSLNTDDAPSEVSTLSSSPASGIEEGKLDAAVLEENLARLGFNITQESPKIRLDGQEMFDEDDEEEEDDSLYRGPLIRSTSLKTGKTPPSTPGRKKFVRFADALGLDLAYIRTITQDDLPNVPKSAYYDLKLLPDPTPGHSVKTLKTQQQNISKALPPWLALYQQASTHRSTAIPEFVQPFTQTNFLDRVRNQRVCLENCMISSGAGSTSVTCIIRVLNVSFEKAVTVRYTTDEWTHSCDQLTSYIPNSCDGWSDRFTVSFCIRSTAPGANLFSGQRVLFAIRYTANNEEYWDNNMGLNYSLVYKM